MANDGEFFNEVKEDRNLYFHRFTWRYGTEYQVAIRGVNVHTRLQGKEVWKTLTLSDCHSVHPEQATVCGPREVVGLRETYQLVDDNTFDINITWSKPDYPPDSYTIEIRDFFVAQIGNRSVGIHRFDVVGVSAAFPISTASFFHSCLCFLQTATAFLAESIELRGSQARVNVTAHRNGLCETSVSYGNLTDFRHTKPRSRVIDILFYTLVTFIAVFLVVLFRVWQNRLSGIVTTLTQKQLESMDLDLIKSITNHSMLEAIGELTRDATMEVDRDSICLMEQLGEGAFGLVKKAIVVRAGAKQQVAVKMLKSE